MAKILVDTSIIIDSTRQRDKTQTFLYKLTGENQELYISMLTHAESHGGKSVWESEDAMELLEKILSGMTILYPDEKISKAAGKIQSEHSIGIVDSIIAATAIAHKLPLA